MAYQVAPHHRGTYKRHSAFVRAYANANPDVRCMSCSKTMAEIRVTKPNATWTAGHVRDGEIGGDLRPECSSCNYSRGAAMGNAKRKPNVSNPW